MPIQQPVQTLIRADDFRDKAFSFTVESVVEDLPASHRDLVVTVSEGYYMTTPLSSQPRQEQTFEHIQQPNQQWVARGTVTLAYAEEYPGSGVLTIQNPVEETTILPIEASHEIAKSSALTISHSELSFTQIASDTPAYLLLTITQQLVDTPITLTMDTPAYFQLASDSHPYYGATLTVVSPVQKFHVHVRYAADKRGVHKGQLMIQTPYESKTVDLQGKWKGWLPTRPRLNTATSQPGVEAPKSASRSGSWLVLVLLACISGLGYVGYTYKCQLFPDLCCDVSPKVTPITTMVKTPVPLPDQSTVPVRLPTEETKSVRHLEKAQQSLPQVIDSLARLRQSFTPKTEPVTVASEEPTVTTRTNVRRRETEKKATDRPGERARPKRTLTNDESELEKVLNKPL